MLSITTIISWSMQAFSPSSLYVRTKIENVIGDTYIWLYALDNKCGVQGEPAELHLLEELLESPEFQI